MGRSANRLSRTRSGVVSPDFLARGFLAPGIARLSLLAPVPPLRLLERQPRIPRLRHGRPEHVQAADVLRLSGDVAEFFVKPFRIAPPELPYTADPQHLEVANHRRSNRNQVLQQPFLCRHGRTDL